MKCSLKGASARNHKPIDRRCVIRTGHHGIEISLGELPARSFGSRSASHYP
jgi:hypothetical protein